MLCTVFTYIGFNWRDDVDGTQKTYVLEHDDEGYKSKAYLNAYEEASQHQSFQVEHPPSSKYTEETFTSNSEQQDLFGTIKVTQRKLSVCLEGANLYSVVVSLRTPVYEVETRCSASVRIDNLFFDNMEEEYMVMPAATSFAANISTRSRVPCWFHVTLYTRTLENNG